MSSDSQEGLPKDSRSPKDTWEALQAPAGGKNLVTASKVEGRKGLEMILLCSRSCAAFYILDSTWFLNF